MFVRFPMIGATEQADISAEFLRECLYHNIDILSEKGKVHFRDSGLERPAIDLKGLRLTDHAVPLSTAWVTWSEILGNYVRNEITGTSSKSLHDPEVKQCELIIRLSKFFMICFRAVVTKSITCIQGRQFGIYVQSAKCSSEIYEQF